jgi:hypothetical protein
MWLRRRLDAIRKEDTDSWALDAKGATTKETKNWGTPEALEKLSRASTWEENGRSGLVGRIVIGVTDGRKSLQLNKRGRGRLPKRSEKCKVTCVASRRHVGSPVHGPMAKRRAVRLELSISKTLREVDDVEQA